MSIASLITDMIIAGIDPEIIGRTAEVFAEHASITAIETDKPKSSGAERQARYRARKAEESVTSDAALRNSDESDVTNVTEQEKEKRTKKEKEDPPPSKEKPPKGGKKKGFPLPDWLPAEPWEAFCQHRGAKFTENAQKLAIGKLERWQSQGHDVAEILNNSTMNGWKGLFEPKQGNHGTNQQKSTYTERLDDATQLGIQLAIAAAEAEDGGSHDAAWNPDQPKLPDFQRLR